MFPVARAALSLAGKRGAAVGLWQRLGAAGSSVGLCGFLLPLAGVVLSCPRACFPMREGP